MNFLFENFLEKFEERGERMKWDMLLGQVVVIKMGQVERVLEGSVRRLERR